MRAREVKPEIECLAVRRLEGEEKSAGGIIIPDTAKEKPSEGKIVAVGSGARNEKGEIVVAKLDIPTPPKQEAETEKTAERK